MPTIQKIVTAVRNMGIANSIALKAADVRMKLAPKDRLIPLRAPGVPTLFCRAGTSDRNVFNQIFVEREYRCIDDVTDADLIIDCGANVGYSAAYFLARHPRAHVIAIEPDAGNFSVLQMNLARWSDRTTLINSGVWSTTTGLVMSENQFGDGREWSYTVRPNGPHEKPTMSAVDIGGLLAQSGRDRISILKIDIEGAEREVFSTNYGAWIDSVDHLVIELHGDDCKAALTSALNGRDVSLSTCDELTVCNFSRKLSRP
jgi:FkbM family methyltransferase